MPQILTTNTRSCRSDPLVSWFITFQASVPDPVGTLHGPSRHLEGSKTAGAFHIFQRIVLSRSVRRPNRKGHKGTRGCPCHSSVVGTEITSLLPGPLMLPCPLSLGKTCPKPFHSHLGLIQTGGKVWGNCRAEPHSECRQVFCMDQRWTVSCGDRGLGI